MDDKLFFKQLTNIIKFTIKRYMNNSNHLQVGLGKVSTIINDKYVTVQIIGQNIDVKLPNGTGSPLKVGDSVKILYHKNDYNTGWIAFKF